ncbi:MAG: hypothetical protein ACTJGH_02875 [Peptoniphilaceae bacterium]
MKSRLKNLFKIAVTIAVLIAFIISFFQQPSEIAEYIDIASYATSIAIVLIILFNKCIWRYIPFLDIPILGNEYIGSLKYSYDGHEGEKPANLKVKQTYLEVKITLTTDEISSITITSDLIQENDKYILYYNYWTIPKSSVSDKNPIQLGTCRLEVLENSLCGNYWTNRKTIGELEMIKKE